MAERRESVRLELQDAGFSTGMVKAAAATAILERSLKSLDGTTVNIDKDMDSSARSVDNFAKSSRDADGSINQLTGRLRVLGEVAAIIGPSLTPLGGVAIAGVGGLANQFGLAAVAGGVLIGSMQGLGDALEAMNKAQLEPTDKNLEKAHDALKALSPAARDFAREAFALKPALVALRDLGAESLFPGLSDSLVSLERLGPQVGSIMEAVAGALGDIASDSAASLASDRWADFFRFIETEGPRTIAELASTVGDLTHGLAELWEAFQPLNRDFSSWMMDVAAGFDSWATGLSATEGFQNFIDYVRETGPQVAETLGAMFNAIVQLVQASAPLGGPVLAGLEAVAGAIAAVADSDIGTPVMAGVTALALLNRTLAVTASLSKVSLNSGLFAGVGQLTGAVRGGANSPLLQLQALPAALKAATSAQDDLAAAQKRASGVTRSYVGQLQAVNTVTSRGFKPSLQTLDRLNDSLDQVELANRDVAVATGRVTEAEERRRAAMRQSAAEVGKGVALVGALAVASSGAADQIGATNTITLALAGSLAGPIGIALGGAAGAFLDWRSAAAQAEAQAKAFDATLKTLSLDELTQGLAEAQALLAALDDDSMARGLVEGNIKSIEDQISATKKLAAEQEMKDRAAAMAYASQVGLNADLAKWQRRSVEDIKAQADALKAVDEQSQQVVDTFGRFPESLNDAKVSLHDFITDMQDIADAMLNFERNARRAAKNGLDDGMVQSLRGMGEEGALRLRQLANASEAEIGRANKAWRSQERAIQKVYDAGRDLAGMSPLDVKVNAETNPAMRNIAALEARLRAIKDEDVFVNVRQIGSTTLGPRNEAADGGTVPKTGRPYADRHLYLLADGEEVISNRHGQADQFRADRAAGLIPGYADGGTTGKKDGKRKPTAGLYVFDNTDRLQAAIDRLTMVQQDNTDALDAATSKQEFWASKMSDLAQATVSGFNTGLFEQSSDPWSAGATGGPIGNLMKDIAGLGERSALQSQLAGAGLSGDALAALLSQGSNADISGLIASGQVSQYADLYNQRAALQGQVGQAAGQAAYGQAFAAAAADTARLAAEAQRTNLELVQANTRLSLMQQALDRMERFGPGKTGDAVATAVKGAVTDGQRDHKNRGGLVRG